MIALDENTAKIYNSISFCMNFHFFYHGSPIAGLKVLRQHIGFTPTKDINTPRVYASPLPEIATVHSFPWSSDEGIDFHFKGGKIELRLPRRLEHRVLQPVSIYEVSPTMFKFTYEDKTGHTWHTTTPVPVIAERSYPTVRAALEKFGGRIKLTGGTDIVSHVAS